MMIFVTDLDEAKRFYGETLAFPVKNETANRIDFAHDGCDLVAFKCEKHGSIEEYGNVARSVFVFEVDSVDARMAEMQNAGISFIHQRPAENEFSRYAAFSDPSGNVHEIFERK